MMTHNDILSEIVHLASAALCADLTEVKKQAIGDIAEACASVVACDFGGTKDGKGDGAPRSGRLRAATPLLRNLPSERSAFCGAFPRPTEGEATDGEATDGELTGFAKFLEVAPGVRLARFAGGPFVEFIGRRKNPPTNGFVSQVYRIRVDRVARCASVWRDDDLLFTIRGGTVGPATLEHVAVSALRRHLKRSSKRHGGKKRGKGGKQEK